MTQPLSPNTMNQNLPTPSEFGQIMRSGDDEKALRSFVKEYLEILKHEQVQWPSFLHFFDDDNGDHDPENDIRNMVIPCLKKVQSKITAILTELDKFPSPTKEHRTYQTLANADICLSQCMDRLRDVDQICEQLFHMGCKNTSST